MLLILLLSILISYYLLLIYYYVLANCITKYKVIAVLLNAGIWVRDIRYKSNLQLPQINKILKSLEGKKLVKSVKSVNVSTTRVLL